MAERINRQILLIEKPTGKLGPEHFNMSDGAGAGAARRRGAAAHLYISLDAANRAWMHGATYRAALEMRRA